MPIPAREFRDPAFMKALYEDRAKGGTEHTWTALEKTYDLVNNNGMSAFRVAARWAKMNNLIADPAPQPAPPKPAPDEGEHMAFGDLVRLITLRLNVLLAGPAGSGKTSGAERASKKMQLAFYPQSVGAQTSLAQLMGYMDAQGKYVRTIFRDAFEKGGVFLLDEIDAGNPNVLTALNSALANEYCSFPDLVVKKHPDFICIAAGNTWGSGADRLYVGRNQLDAATLDRFAKVVWDYDEKLEVKISGNCSWARRVQALRKSAWTQKLRVIVSPRATLGGAKMLAAGFSQSEVEDILIFNATDTTTADKILVGAGDNPRHQVKASR